VLGNGGSAADAQHFAAELVSRDRLDRRALSAIALTTDSSALTAIVNDYGFERVFSRQLEAIGKPGDVVLALSTSGNSINVIRALEYARSSGMTGIGLSGERGQNAQVGPYMLVRSVRFDISHSGSTEIDHLYSGRNREERDSGCFNHCFEVSFERGM
jgi:phosphoheptose isomerase